MAQTMPARASHTPRAYYSRASAKGPEIDLGMTVGDRSDSWPSAVMFGNNMELIVCSQLRAGQ
jgi:hypothetical protein